MEDSCLGFCFEVHRAVKCGYFFLDDTDPDSMKDFGELQWGQTDLGHREDAVDPGVGAGGVTVPPALTAMPLLPPEIVDQPGLDIFGQVFNQWKSKECVCPNCSRSIAASRFAPHLEKCLGMGRNSSRIANRR